MRRVFSTIFTVTLLLIFSVSVSYAGDVQNFQYDYWAAYSPGSTVKFKATFTNSNSQKTSENVVTWIIKEIKADRVILGGESALVVEGKEMKIPEGSEIKRMVSEFEQHKYKNAGNEMITVEAGTFQCKKTMRTSNDQGGTITTTSWWSDEVPGGLVKTIVTGGQVETIKEVISFNAATSRNSRQTGNNEAIELYDDSNDVDEVDNEVSDISDLW